MKVSVSRRGFLGSLATAVAIGDQPPSIAREGKGLRGFDHVALPMQNTEAMLVFYRKLGLQVVENANACAVYIGNQMINFHRPAHWQDRGFTLRAPAAQPPCGDLCFVWDDTPEALRAMIDRVGVEVVEWPVDRQGGRKRAGTSTYIRDPDGNLLEFMIYS
jgi:catechol 2,3-dioxygenase-like lactoylglutathione lyase family enzyme